MREDVVFEQTKEIPLCASLGLKVPEYPTAGELLEHVQLGLDIVACIVLQLLIPRVDEVDLVAGTHAWTSRIPAIIASTNAVTIEGRCTVSHRRRPLAHNHPVISVGRVTASMVANEVSVFLLF